VAVKLWLIFVLGMACAVVSCGGSASKPGPASGGAAGASPTVGSGPAPHDGSPVGSTGGAMGDASDVSPVAGGAGAAGSTAGTGGATGGATTGTKTTATGGVAAGGSATDGKSGTGGAGTGGTPVLSSATGGAATGGVVTGGRSGSGGAVGSGGASGTGGVVTGGRSGSGGAVGSGGASDTGGVVTGGRSGNGGAIGTGGAAGTGGAMGGVSTGGAATGGASTCSPGPPSTGGTAYCNQNASGSYGDYQWSLWSNTATGCLTTYSGGAFNASWNSSGDLLARVGLKLDATKTPRELGTFSADFAESKTGTAGTYSYIGIYAWTVDPNTELYIVQDAFSLPPVKPNASLLGTLAADGGTYDIYTVVVSSTAGSITQVFSIRRTSRSCGHISISEHFSKWAELGVQLGNLDSVDVFVESGGGTGSIDFATARLVLE